MAGVCGCAMAAGGTHALVCGALWHTVVTRHNMTVSAFRRDCFRARAGISSSLHTRSSSQRLRAAGQPVIPSRLTGSHTLTTRPRARSLLPLDRNCPPALPSPSLQSLLAPRLPATAPPPFPGQAASSSHSHCAPGHTTCVAGHADRHLPRRHSSHRRRLPLPRPSQLPPLLPLERPMVLLPQPSLSCPSPQGPRSLPGPVPPPSQSHATRDDASAQQLPPRTHRDPEQLTCWECIRAVRSCRRGCMPIRPAEPRSIWRR